jgi:predicted O-methyltransferase YrrM
MRHEHAVWLRDVIQQNGFSRLCELGFYHGKSTTYFAAILQEQGFGKIHTFDKLPTYSTLVPSIDQLLSDFGLGHLVTKTVAEKCFLWELGKLIEQHDQPIFDFCYIDGGHDFNTTALAFVLIDKLLQPGGMVIFDDVNWCAETNSVKDYTAIYPVMSEEESRIPAVNFVCDNIVSKYNYTELPHQEFDWRVYVKNK